MKRFYGRKLFEENNNNDDYFGDKRIRPYLSYDKNEPNSHCIYCADIANSREHIPPRIFLDKPYPDNCSIAPACKVCNQRLSIDEQFVACLIEYWKSIAYNKPIERPKVLKTINHSPAILTRIKEMFDENGHIVLNRFNEFDSRIKNVAGKLVIGHAFYDLNQFFEHNVNNNPVGIKCSDFSYILSNVKYAFVNNLSDDTIREFNQVVNSGLMPEIGSRKYVNEVRLNGLYGWTVIQPNTYRYLTAPGLVRIVIQEVLYIEGEVF